MPRSRHLLLLFFLSGVSGLIYESLWARYLRLFVGSAATAQILVLALFMGGMSIGAFLAGRFSERLRRPILVYGVIEGVIGLFAWAFPWLFLLGTRACYDVMFPALSNPAAVGAVKWGMAGLLVVIPCVLLGMTFPLMSVGILRRDPKRSGEILSLLYFSNSFGAAAGALLAGFLLVPALGLPGTLVVGGALNVLILLATLRERSVDPPLGPGIDVDDLDGEATEPEPDEHRASLASLVAVIAAATGLSSFMYEVGWMRLLSMILGSATHSFEAMLSAFVFGLACGGLWVRRRMDQFSNPVMVLGVVQVIMGMAAIATLPLYKLGVSGMGAVFWQEVPTESMWVSFNVTRYLIALLIMLPATFCAGMTLPLATHVLLRAGHHERVVGRIYGVNTLGAIIGATLAGLVLMPVIGLGGVIVVGAAIDMVLGVVLLRRVARGVDRRGGGRALAVSWKRAAIAAVTMTIFGVLNARPDPRVLAAGVFRRGRTVLEDAQETLSHVDGRTATVTVMADRTRPGYRSMYTNGKPDASVRLDHYPPGHPPEEGPALARDAANQILVGALPLMARPDARRVATIGIGSGVSSHVMLASPTIERLDTIEIEPEMTRAARLFSPVNDRIYEDPRSVIIHDDAKSYFASGRGQYDLIISQPSNPWVSGVSSLFTVEFYGEIERYLAPGGLVGQWIHGYELNDELLFSVLAALDRSFADYRIYRVENRDWMILASRDGPVPPLSEAALSWPDMKLELDLLGMSSLSQFEALHVADRQLLHAHLRGYEANSDARPILDNGAERARFFEQNSEALLALRWLPLPIQEAFSGVERSGYPRQGIPAKWTNKHVLYEPEKANLMLDAYDRNDERPVAGTAEIRRLFAHRRGMRVGSTDEEAWAEWFGITYDIYNQTAPWADLPATRWWRDTLTDASREDAPEWIGRGVALLDAAARRDGPALRRAVNDQHARSDQLFDPRLVALAGAVALGLEDAPARERREYVQRHMARLGNGSTTDDLAFRIVRDALDPEAAGSSLDGVSLR